MNKNIWIGVIVAVVVVGIGVWLVGRQDTSPAEITLGVVAGTTGDYAAAGEGYVSGFELARGEWNSTHTLQFRDITEDDGFNAQKGVSAYSKLKNIDAVDAYAILSTFTVDAVYDQLHAEGRPVALGFEQSIPAADDNIFQVLPAARPVQEGLGAYAKRMNYKNPVLLVSNNSPVYQNFAAGFVDGYGRDVTKENITGDVAGLRVLATKIVSEKYDLVVFYMVPKDGAILAREILARSKGQHPQFAFDQSIQSGMPDYKTVFGDTLNQLDGSIVALSKNDLTDTFKSAYKEKYDADPPFGSDMGYNSFMLLATTYDTRSSRWIANMKKARFTGADGEVYFDDTGLRVPNTQIAEMRNGDVVPK